MFDFEIQASSIPAQQFGVNYIYFLVIGITIHHFSCSENLQFSKLMTRSANLKKEGTQMNISTQVKNTCCLSLLLLSHNSLSIITLRALPNTTVHLQVAWATDSLKALVVGNASDAPRYFTKIPDNEAQDVTLSNMPGQEERKFTIQTSPNKQLYLAIAGYHHDRRVSQHDQLLLPVTDGADLIVEDNGDGDIAITPMPEIKIINNTNTLQSIIVYIKDLVEKFIDFEYGDNQSDAAFNTKPRIPWQHRLTKQEVELAPASDPLPNGNMSQSIEGRIRYRLFSFAPKFMYWNTSEHPLLSVIDKATPGVKSQPIHLPIDLIFPLNGKQTVVEVHSTQHKAYLLSAAGIISCFEKSPDGPFITVHQGDPIL